MSSIGGAPATWQVGGAREQQTDSQNYIPSGSPVKGLLDRLDGVRTTGCRQWIALCPAHEDSAPSLAVREVDGGVVLLHCFAGCATYEIVSTVGLKLCHLFPPREAGNGAERARLDARQVLRCIAKEALIIRLYAQDVISGTLTEADIARLRLAETRIGEALSHAG